MTTSPTTATTGAWNRLHDGALLVQTDERARSASEYRPETIPPLVDDPTSADVLPQLGYHLEPTTYPSWAEGPRRSHTWKRPYLTNSFMLQLPTRLQAVVRSEGRDDGTVHQVLTTEDAINAWVTHRTTLFGATPERSPTTVVPKEHDLPTHLAYAVARLPGDGWKITADSIERTLPPWPLRYVPSATPLKLELKTKLRVDCVGWAYLPANSPDNEGSIHELVYLSGVGPHKKLRAAWAMLMDRRREIIKVPTISLRGYMDIVSTRRMEGSRVYASFWNDNPLPESGMAHLVIQHRSLHTPRTAQPFLHLVGADGTPHLAQFVWQLDQASTLPIKPSWAQRLWNDGRTADVIVALPSYGCQAYWIRPDDATWAELIARCAGATGTVTIETYGGNEDDGTPPVAMIVSDEDDDITAPGRSPDTSD